MPRALLIQWRRDYADKWTSVNPILAQGEPGAEVDTGRLKVGDGVSDWVSLPYMNPGFVVLGMEDPVPEKTPSGTVIFRYSA